MRKWQTEFNCSCGKRAFLGQRYCSVACQELYRRPNPTLGDFTPEKPAA
jgi:hypothetical protein